jgi:hypothetical protein
MRWDGKAWISAILVVAGAVLAFIGYFEMMRRPEFGLSGIEVWRETFLLTGGLVTWPFLAPPLGLQRIHDIPWPLELARFVVPLGVFSGAGLLLARAFGAKFRAFRSRFARDHIVVCAGGPAAWQFVADLQRDSRSRVVVLDLDTTRKDIEGGAPVPILPVAGGIDEAPLLRAAVPWARAIVALGNDDILGLEIMLRAKSVAAKHRPPHAAPLIGRAALSRGTAEDATEALFGTRDRSFDYRPISVARNTVRQLFQAHPLDRDPVIRGGGRPHIRIVGFDAVGQELALEVARSGYFTDGWLPLITLIDPEANRRFDRLAQRAPDLGKAAEFRLVTARIEDIPTWDDRADRLPLARTVLCLDDEILGLRTAAALRQRWAGIETPAPAIFVHLARAPIAAEALRTAEAQGPGPAIVPFGDAASLFTRDIVLDETLDTLAREVHAHYRENRVAHGDADANLPADRPWDDLPESFREASRHQADHMLPKLRLIGCAAMSDRTAPPFAFSPDEIEQLSRIEHRRWSAERWVAGWQFAPARRDEAREHPSLVSWEELSESEREKDREAVRAIPAVLARAGLAIRRRPGAA